MGRTMKGGVGGEGGGGDRKGKLEFTASQIQEISSSSTLKDLPFLLLCVMLVQLLYSYTIFEQSCIHTDIIYYMCIYNVTQLFGSAKDLCILTK